MIENFLTSIFELALSKSPNTPNAITWGQSHPMKPAQQGSNGKTPFCQPPYAIRAFNILGEPCQFASRSTQERTEPAGRRRSSHSAGTRTYRRREPPMTPYHRSRPVPPPASRRSGPGSREVPSEKWNFLRDEEARLCALNPWGRPAGTMCRPMRPRGLLASPCGPCPTGRSSMGRGGSVRTPDGPGGCAVRHGPTS